MSHPKTTISCGHSDQPPHGYGKCKRCYQREWLRNTRSRAKCSEPGCRRVIHARGVCAAHHVTRYRTTPKGPGKQYGSVYPQELVRVPVKGWGCI